MPKTNADRQREYRQRRRAGGTVQCTVLVPAWAASTIRQGASELCKIREDAQLGAIVGFRDKRGRRHFFKL